MRIVHVARKPLIGSVAKNVLEYGTGGLNIGGCRIGSAQAGWGGGGRGTGTWTEDSCGLKEGDPRPVQGRWPANLVLEHRDQCVKTGEKELDLLSPELGDGASKQVAELWDCSGDCPVSEIDRQGKAAVYFKQVQADPDFIRASGDVVCAVCGKTYFNHRVDGRLTWLHVLCDGTRVKL